MAHRTKRPDKRRRVALIHRMQGEADNASPLEIAMNRAAKLLPAERELLVKPVQAAFQAFKLGQGNAAHLAALADALNVGADLAEKVKIASNHTGTLDAGRAAVLSLLDRYATSGSWTLKGTEIAALDEALFICRVQLDYCSRGELAGAVQRVISRCQSALADDAAGRAPANRVYDIGALGTAYNQAAQLAAAA